LNITTLINTIDKKTAEKNFVKN